MKIEQMHDLLRIELLRRVDDGDLTVSRLSEQTGLTKSHVSKYLHAGGRLSRDAMDLILEAQDIEAEHLLEPGAPERRSQPLLMVPVVSRPLDMFSPEVRTGTSKMWLAMSKQALLPLEDRMARSRQSWRRFVAMRIDDEDAEMMNDLAHKGAIVIVDRHYNSLRPCHPPRQNIYVVRDGRRVVVRYVDAIAGQLIIRPLNSERPVDWLEGAVAANPGEYIAGRVAKIMNEV